MIKYKFNKLNITPDPRDNIIDNNNNNNNNNNDIDIDIDNIFILEGGRKKFIDKILPLKIVKVFEPLAQFYNISRKSRGLNRPTKSDKGFLAQYKDLKGNWKNMKNLPVKKSKPTGEKWEHHRKNYCKRRLSMINRIKNYGLYDENGLPTIMHVNMLMWAASPDYTNIMKNYKKLEKKIIEKIKKN
jgi:hypothetical protein